MATIINNPPAATAEQSSFTAFIIAAIAILVFTVVVVLYLLPALSERDSAAADAAPAVAAPQTQGATASEVSAEPVVLTLTTEQRAAIQALGVDSAQIPTTVSLDQVACFEGILGADRVAEIRSGAVPSEFEFFKVQGCI